MSVSVESRAVQINETLSTFSFSAAHVPVKLSESDFRAFICQTFEVPHWKTMTPDEIYAVRQKMTQNWSWQWDKTLPSFARRCIQAATLGDLAGEPAYHWGLPSWDLRLPMTDRKVGFAIDMVFRLWNRPEGTVNGTSPVELDAIFDYQFSVGMSPALKTPTLRELVGSTRSIVMFPLAATTLLTVSNLIAGQWMTALMAAGAGTGATIMIGGGASIAERFLHGIKQLGRGQGPEPTQQAREQPLLPEADDDAR